MVALALAAAAPVPAQGHAGSIDRGFGVKGKVVTLFPGGTQAGVSAVAIQPDGRLVAAGTVHAYDGVARDEFGLARYDRRGRPDRGFGSGGLVLTDIRRGAIDVLEDVALQHDGKIVVAGTSCTSVNPYTCDFAVARYDAQGTLDATFGSGGTRTFGVGVDAVDTEARAVAVDSEGRIVIGGLSCGAGQCKFAVVRLEPDGSTDRSFGKDGSATTTFGGLASQSLVNDLTVQPDGKILAVGETGPALGGSESFALARYDSVGQLDPTFASGGKLTDLAGFGNRATAATLGPQGKPLVVGPLSSHEGWDLGIARYSAAGALDARFGTRGHTRTTVMQIAEPEDVALDSAGRPVVVGGACCADHRERLVVLRYRRGGRLDRTFAGGGVRVRRSGARDSTAYATAVQRDDKIVAGGTECPPCGFTLVRYLGR